MPNHVKHIIDTSVANLMSSDKSAVDFNTVIPMPDSLHNPDPQQMESRAKIALGLFDKSTLKGDPQDISTLTGKMEFLTSIRSATQKLDQEKVPLLIQAIQNIIEYGHAYWYPWACENWGVKWNAYEIEEDGGRTTFETAWSHPQPVFIELSKQNPEKLIKVTYADEDLGSNAKEIHYKGGEVVFERDLSFVECFEINRPGEDYRKHGYDENGNYDEDKDESWND